MTTTYIFSDSSDLQIEIIIVNIQFATTFIISLAPVLSLSAYFSTRKKETPLICPHQTKCPAFSHPTMVSQPPLQYIERNQRREISFTKRMY